MPSGENYSKSSMYHQEMKYKKKRKKSGYSASKKGSKSMY